MALRRGQVVFDLAFSHEGDLIAFHFAEFVIKIAVMELSGRPLSLPQIAAVAIGEETVEIASSVHGRVRASRNVVESIVERGDVVYGVNTGFGKLSDVRVAPEELLDLQLNLVRSHSCGIGAPLSPRKSAR